MLVQLLLLVSVVGYIEAKPSMVAFPSFFSSSSSKVVGGEDASPGEFPWQLSQQRQGATGNWAHSCGASLLSNTRSLTAAHCVEGANVNIMRIIAGLHTRSVTDGTVTSNVDRYVMNAEYNAPDATFANDIAIIYSTDPIAANGGTIQYARLPSNDLQNFAGDGCVVSGWGRTSSSNVLPDTLQKAAIPVLNVPACRVQFAVVSPTIWDKQICAYDDTGVMGACTSDDGGPLNCEAGVGSRVVAGIMSWTMTGPLGNCQQSFPSVFTRTSSYLAWISGN